MFFPRLTLSALAGFAALVAPLHADAEPAAPVSPAPPPAAAPAAKAQPFRLTPAQVGAKLSVVPVFVVVDTKGQPLNSQGYALGFLSPSQAEAMRVDVESKQPALRGQLRLQVISLGDALAHAMRPQGHPLRQPFVMMARPQDQADAQALLGQPMHKVPVFAVRTEQDGRKTYICVERDGVPSLPVFFEKAPAQELLEFTRRTNMILGPSAAIEVTTLDNILAKLGSPGDPLLAQVAFHPLEEARRFLLALQPTTLGAPPAAVTAAPPAPAEPARKP